MSRRIALLVGNSIFRDREYFPGLSTPANNLADLSRALRTHGGFEIIDHLLDMDAKALQESIEELYLGAKRGDLTLLYYAGHGYKDAFGNYYLVAADTLTTKILTTALKESFIDDAMRRSRARHHIVLLDCCYSGSLIKGIMSGEQAIEFNLLPGEATIILASSSPSQYSFELEGDRNSLFTQYLIQGIETGGADLDRDGEITVSELFEYTESHVRDREPAQTPMIRRSSRMGDIVIAQNPVLLPALSATGEGAPVPALSVTQRRHVLTLTSPMAEYTVRYPALLLRFRSFLNREVSFDLVLPGAERIKAGRCGITPIRMKVEGSSSQDSETAVGFQIWLFDLVSGQDLSINLGLPAAAKGKVWMDLTARRETKLIREKLVFYRETDHLLLQGTVERFNPSFSPAFTLNPVAFIRSLFQHRQVGLDRYQGMAVRFRIWPQAARVQSDRPPERKDISGGVYLEYLGCHLIIAGIIYTLLTLLFTTILKSFFVGNIILWVILAAIVSFYALVLGYIILIPILIRKFLPNVAGNLFGGQPDQMDSISTRESI